MQSPGLPVPRWDAECQDLLFIHRESPCGIDAAKHKERSKTIDVDEMRNQEANNPPILSQGTKGGA